MVWVNKRKIIYIVYIWSKGKQKLLRVSGRFEFLRVRVTKGKIALNVWQKSRGNRLWFKLARVQVIASQLYCERFKNKCNTVKPPIKATSTQWPPLYCGHVFCSGGQSLPKWPLDNGQFFKELMKKSRMVIQFDLYGILIINPGNCILIVFHFILLK